MPVRLALRKAETGAVLGFADQLGWLKREGLGAVRDPFPEQISLRELEEDTRWEYAPAHTPELNTINLLDMYYTF